MPKLTRRSGAELRALLERYKLYGNDGADVAAQILGTGRKTIQVYLSAGIAGQPFNHLALALAAKRRAKRK